MAPTWLSQLHDLLGQQDGPDLIGRGSRITVAGKADRRVSVFLPLMTKWAQHRYLAKDAPLSIGTVKKGFALRIADRRKRA